MSVDGIATQCSPTNSKMVFRLVRICGSSAITRSLAKPCMSQELCLDQNQPQWRQFFVIRQFYAELTKAKKHLIKLTSNL
jgi:hypothetical protein